MTRLPVLLALVVAAFAAANPAIAADPLRTGSSIDAPPIAPPPIVVAEIGIAGLPVLGSADAPVTVVEFMDYECPYCQDFGSKTFPIIKEKYVATGQVRWVAGDFPLPRHPRARPAAIAAACAGEQGKFWEMHDELLRNAGQLRNADFAKHAEKLGLDAAAFTACNARTDHGERLDVGIAAARAIGVGGTPSFLVGASRTGVARGRLARGSDLAAVIASYLPNDEAAAAVEKPVSE